MNRLLYGVMKLPKMMFFYYNTYSASNLSSVSNQNFVKKLKDKIEIRLPNARTIM